MSRIFHYGLHAIAFLHFNSNGIIGLLRCNTTFIRNIQIYSTEDGKFSLDKEKFAIVDSRVNDHIEKKGLLAFFPEGQINSNPERLLQFRYGGMKKALQYDASLFFFVNTGNHSVWPRKAAIGGFPGSVKYRVECITKDGCSKLVSQLKENKLLLQKHGCDVKSPDHEILSKYLRSAMQDTLDAMNSADQKKEA